MMTPKSLLRHKLCVSNLSDMAENTSFHRIILDPNKNLKDKNVNRVVICSGKIFYHLYEEREKNNITDVKLLRLEQIYPFPSKTLERELKKTPNAKIIWCQEEPKNMGSWFFVDRNIEDVLTKIKSKFSRPIYVGRAEAASPATGSLSRHLREQDNIVKESLNLIKPSKKAVSYTHLTLPTILRV